MAVYFWDTSALAKYYHIELGSDYVESLLQSAEHRHFVSEVTLVEMLSITAAKVRCGDLHEDDLFMFRKVFQQDLQDKLLHILRLDSSTVATAQELVSRHGMTHGIGLRSLDAIQLASVCALKDDGFCRFVNSDKRLGVAAKKEGFALINPEVEKLDK